MNRTAFSLPEHSDYRTSGGLAISRTVEQFTGDAKRLDDLIELLDRRRGVVLSSGTTVPGRYESFDFGFADLGIGQRNIGENRVVKQDQVLGSVADLLAPGPQIDLRQREPRHAALCDAP